MKILKNNQIIIYAFVLMLMVAGYFNYAEKVSQTSSVTSLETSMQIQSKSDEQLADIGDAILVNSNDIYEENKENDNIDQNQNNKQEQQNEVEEEILQTSSEITEYFIKSKLDRDKMYSEMIATYESVLENPNSSETQKQSVVEEITKISDIKSKIMICESLLEIKGFEDVLIYLNDESVNVIINAEELQQEQVAQIQNIVSREMAVELTNIHISTKT